jgi:hypothetical protein
VIVLAHAGHWLVQLIYLVPLAVLVGVIVSSRLRERRDGRKGSGRDGDSA